MKIFFFIIFNFLFISTKAANINICISDIDETKKACLWIGLYNQKEGFPKPEKAAEVKYIEVLNTEMQLKFENLIPGEYAVIVFHDENRNKKFDANFMHIPLEGYGFSQNPKFFGPPQFDKAKFIINNKDLIIRIKMKY